MVTLSEWYVQNTHKGFMCNNCGKLVNKSDMERYLVARVRTGSGFHQSCGIGIGSGLASNPAGSQPGSRPRRPGPSWTPRSPWRALRGPYEQLRVAKWVLLFNNFLRAFKWAQLEFSRTTRSWDRLFQLQPHNIPNRQCMQQRKFHLWNKVQSTKGI